MEETYRNVTIEGRNVYGEKRYSTKPDGWCLFSGTVSLMKINAVMDASPRMITRLMDLADGYGEQGYFPNGYDWSGFRDSSPAAIVAMEKKADEWAKRHKYQWPWEVAVNQPRSAEVRAMILAPTQPASELIQ